MDEIEKTQQQVTEAMEKDTTELIPFQGTLAWGNQQTSPELRGYATLSALLTPEQMNGEFRFLLKQFFDGINSLAETNVKKPE